MVMLGEFSRHPSKDTEVDYNYSKASDRSLHSFSVNRRLSVKINSTVYMSTVVEDRVAERCLHRLRHCEEPKQVSSGWISFDYSVFVLDRYTPLDFEYQALRFRNRFSFSTLIHWSPALDPFALHRCTLA